jgi:hypothetical protein
MLIMDQKTLKDVLDYNPKTGVFIWRINRPPRCKAGQIAGYNNGSGYIKIAIQGKRYYAHRLAFIWMEDSVPKVVDHINGVRYDNRWENLRNVTPIENGANKLIGKGVRQQKQSWHARYANKHLGAFQSQSAAENAYYAEKIKKAGVDVIKTKNKNTSIKNPINKRYSYKVQKFDGKTANQWAKILGIPQPTINYQINVQGKTLQEIVLSKGMTKAQALEVPRYGCLHG